jgi:hypothetical protein
MKKCSASLTIKEMQIKTTETPSQSKWQSSRKKQQGEGEYDKQVLARIQRKKNPYTLLVGMYIS